MLLVGGSGTVGRWAARFLRAAHPGVPLLLGGRGLATATGAPNVQFKLALGVSSSRRRGEPLSTEILIELAGEDPAGRPLRTRHAVVNPQGQMPLTGLSVALVLERLLGLDGQPAVPAGLYFPCQLLDSATYFARLKQMGGQVLTLEVL